MSVWCNSTLRSIKLYYWVKNNIYCLHRHELFRFLFILNFSVFIVGFILLNGIAILTFLSTNLWSVPMLAEDTSLLFVRTGTFGWWWCNILWIYSFMVEGVFKLLIKVCIIYLQFILCKKKISQYFATSMFITFSLYFCLPPSSTSFPILAFRSDNNIMFSLAGFCPTLILAFC